MGNAEETSNENRGIAGKNAEQITKQKGMNDSNPAPSNKPPLQPGKGFGLISMLCGIAPFLVWPCSIMTIVILGLDGFEQIIIALPCLLLNIFCAFLALVFGLLGRKTEGRRYADIGIAFALLFIMLQLGIIACVIMEIL